MWTWNADAEPAATTTGESKTKTKTGDRDRSRSRRIDCIVLPVAPHPVAEIDRYNAIGYTSSLVLLDYPAGVIPVRRVESSDLELGKEMTTPVLGRWDQGNRELCELSFIFLPFFLFKLYIRLTSDFVQSNRE